MGAALREEKFYERGPLAGNPKRELPAGRGNRAFPSIGRLGRAIRKDCVEHKVSLSPPEEERFPIQIGTAEGAFLERKKTREKKQKYISQKQLPSSVRPDGLT